MLFLARAPIAAAASRGSSSLLTAAMGGVGSRLLQHPAVGGSLQITAGRPCTRSFATITPEICGSIYLTGACVTVAATAGVALADAVRKNSWSHDDDVSDKVWRVLTEPVAGAVYGIAIGAVWPVYVPVYAYYSWRGHVQRLQREQADEDRKK
jgi:hypothetical protein